MIRSLLRSGGFVLLLVGALMSGAARVPSDLAWPIMRWFFGGLIAE